MFKNIKFIVIVLIAFLATNCQSQSDSELSIIKEKLSAFTNAVANESQQEVMNSLASSSEINNLSSKISNKSLKKALDEYLNSTDLIKELKRDFKGNDKDWNSLKPIFYYANEYKDKYGVPLRSGRLIIGSSNHLYKVKISVLNDIDNNKYLIFPMETDISKMEVNSLEKTKREAEEDNTNNGMLIIDFVE